MTLLLFFIIIFICLYEYNFNGGNNSFDKLLNNIIKLTSIGCTKNHINDNTYYSILKHKNDNELHKICKDAYSSKLSYENDINQQLCCEKNTICLPKCKKHLTDTDVFNFKDVFINNIQKTKSQLNIFKNNLDKFKDDFLSSMISLKNILTIYKT